MHTLWVRIEILERQRKSRIVLKSDRKKIFIRIWCVYHQAASIRAYFLVCIQCLYVLTYHRVASTAGPAHSRTHIRARGLVVTIERIWLTNAIDATKKLCVLDSLVFACHTVGKKPQSRRNKRVWKFIGSCSDPDKLSIDTLAAFGWRVFFLCTFSDAVLRYAMLVVCIMEI